MYVQNDMSLGQPPGILYACPLLWMTGVLLLILWRSVQTLFCTVA